MHTQTHTTHIPRSTWPGTSQNCVWDAAVLIRGAAPAASIAIHNNAFKDALTAIRLDGYLGSAPTGVSFSVAADLNAWGPPNTAVLESQLKPRINVGPYSQAAVKYLPYYVTYSGKFGPPQPGFVPQGYTVQGERAGGCRARAERDAAGRGCGRSLDKHAAV